MLLLYFKQAWSLLSQEKLFSSIHVVGTGLSITLVMLLSIVFHIRIANVYPETNRDRTLVFKSAMETYGGGDNSSSVSLKLIDECLRPIEEIEALTVMFRDWDEHYMQLTASREQVPVTVKYTDAAFWTVFSFRFIDGKPFTEADFESGIAATVISESTARRLFGRTDVTGEYAGVDFKQYRICGVVKDASFVTERSYANFWMPYTLVPDYAQSYGQSGYLGGMQAVMLASSVSDISRIKQKAEAWVEQLNRSSNGEFTFKALGQPDRHWESTFRYWSNVAPDFIKIACQYGAVFLILLLVPAISLSGMTDSRMERRLAEMGIRRAFGAPAGNLTMQVFSENFLFTLLGGMTGLLFSYLLIFLTADWIMSIGGQLVDLPPEGTKVIFTPGMLMNLPVFLIALATCFGLNLMTAMIPAWKASHRDIIYSLNAKL
ncbi:MAG: ABC transporter permease [Tannerellaceae bacterium]|jgi:putative ABC transport system permease protein|nr:ABC transporter permease [Tannerellaceae bacterium]